MNKPTLNEILEMTGAENKAALLDEYKGKSVREIYADLKSWADDIDLYQFALDIHYVVTHR